MYQKYQPNGARVPHLLDCITPLTTTKLRPNANQTRFPHSKGAFKYYISTFFWGGGSDQKCLFCLWG